MTKFSLCPLQRLILRLLAVLPLALLLPSCAITGHGKPSPLPSNGCEWVSPIMVSPQDVLTDGTAKQILALDQTWQKICGASTTPRSQGTTSSRR